jgi:hypothetical protein
VNGTGAEGGLAHRIEAIVRVYGEIPAEARTAASLGRERPMRLVVMAAAIGARDRSRDTLPGAHVGLV